MLEINYIIFSHIRVLFYSLFILTKSPVKIRNIIRTIKLVFDKFYVINEFFHDLVSLIKLLSTWEVEEHSSTTVRLGYRPSDIKD